MLRMLSLICVGVACCGMTYAQETTERPAEKAVCPVLPQKDATAFSGLYVQFSEIEANEGFAEQLKNYGLTKLGVTKNQPGMISCTLMTDPEDKNKFTVVEIWHSKKHLEVFRKSADYERVHGPDVLKKMEGWVAEFNTRELTTSTHWAANQPIGENPSAKNNATTEVSAASPYLLATCALSGRPLDVKGSRTMVEVEGRQIGTCCGGCAKFLQKDPAKYLKAVDEAHAAQQRPIYPMKTCLISGDELTDDNAIEIMVGNRLFRVCCAGCGKAIKADPAKYVAMLDEAARKQQSKNYALEICPVSGKKTTGDNASDVMVGGRLVRLCCEGCKTEFEKDKIAVVAKIDAALAKQRGE